MEVGEGRAADGAAEGAAEPRPSTEPVDGLGASEADVIARSRHERDRSMVAHGRRLAGTPGAIMAGAMIALRDIYEAPRDQRIVATAESPTDPIDVDTDGVDLPKGEIAGLDDLHVPAQPRRAPIVPGRRRARRR
jgi:hypothetical protein